VTVLEGTARVAAEVLFLLYDDVTVVTILIIFRGAHVCVADVSWVCCRREVLMCLM
jgi:hypothetical protein